MFCKREEIFLGWELYYKAIKIATNDLDLAGYCCRREPNKVRCIPPASLTGISLIPSEACFRPVREAGYEPTLKLPLQERTIV